MSKATHMAEISQNKPKNTPETPETHYISPKTGHKVKISTLDNLKPAVKGEVRNPEGRAAGTKIRKTKQWEVLHEHISGVHTERFNRAMKQLPDKEFIDAYLRILEYFKPRLQRAENINMNTQLDRVVLVTSPDDIPTLPDNFDEDQEQDQQVHDITPDEVQPDTESTE